MRADAIQNRQRILLAAEEVFSREGPSASTERIAEVAGVGVGSVFRHFPTKGDLLEAVLKKQLGELTREAERLLKEGDPGSALFAFLARAADVARTKSALAAPRPAGGEGVTYRDIPEGGQLRRLLAALLRSAQKAGRVRADIGAEEVILLFWSVLRTAGSLAVEPPVLKRMIAVILDGLGSSGTGSSRPSRGA